ncbi:protein FAR1-RELATED SEQUENCE 11-like [Salvia splendens]|uniref:protein FAR1-RELATED SEQUENCE 11-like n=1 Tax=Salvia splendens TaxID=180675 RepID=UPI001C2624DD|nr:protein FAR1-RELATED SEQUENCE 11-like [Salvia splendens]
MGLGYVIQSFVEEHNHEMVEEHHKRFMNLNSNLDLVHQKFILDCANANIGPTLSFSLLKEVLGGLDYVGCTVLEVRNYRHDLRAYVEGADAQMLLNELRRKKELCSAFTYEYEVNSKDRMTRLFWCDPTARRNYHLYGDIVSFDTTYSTNRYCMIFAPFTGKDNHGRPVTFAAGLLSKENANSFSWLFNQFVKCMGVAPKLIVTDQDLGMKVAVEENNFFKRYSKSRANLMQFYMNYNHALETQRSNSAKLEYYDSTKVPILQTGLEIEKHASTIYSGSAYTEIQEEIVYACFSLSCATLGVSTNTDIEVYDIKDKDSNSWTVTYSIAQSIEGNIDQINAFAAIIEEGRKQLLGEDVVLSSTQKRAMIENFYGSHVPNNIEVHPPEVVSTKGSGSRKKSKRESAIKLAMKPGRKCGNCHEIGHHDSRNCKKVNEKSNQWQ